jgi:hypothetical protein
LRRSLGCQNASLPVPPSHLPCCSVLAVSQIRPPWTLPSNVAMHKPRPLLNSNSAENGQRTLAKISVRQDNSRDVAGQ